MTSTHVYCFFGLGAIERHPSERLPLEEANFQYSTEDPWETPDTTIAWETPDTTIAWETPTPTTPPPATRPPTMTPPPTNPPPTEPPNRCYVYGTCEDFAVGFTHSLSVDDCLDFCRLTSLCNWFTQDNDQELCIAFQSCYEFSESACPDCVSGDRR